MGMLDGYDLLFLKEFSYVRQRKTILSMNRRLSQELVLLCINKKKETRTVNVSPFGFIRTTERELEEVEGS